MRAHKRIYDMTDRELRIYKRALYRKRIMRRKLIMATVTVCLVAMLTISLQTLISSANSGKEEIKFKYYTSIEVKYGESLWDIAGEFIDTEEYKNTGVYVAEVKSINHLNENGDIKAGQTLIVPYYSSEFKN